MTPGVIAAIIEGSALIVTAIIRKVKSEDED